MQIFDYIPLQTRQSLHAKRLWNGCVLLALGVSVAALIPLTQALLEAQSAKPLKNSLTHHLSAYGAKPKNRAKPKKTSNMSTHSSSIGTPVQNAIYDGLADPIHYSNVREIQALPETSHPPKIAATRKAAARALAKALVPVVKAGTKTKVLQLGKKQLESSFQPTPKNTFIERSPHIIKNIQNQVITTKQKIKTLTEQKSALSAQILKYQKKTSRVLNTLAHRSTDISSHLIDDVTKKTSRDKLALATAQKTLNSLTKDLKKEKAKAITAQNALTLVKAKITALSPAYRAAKAAMPTLRTKEAQDKELLARDSFDSWEVGNPEWVLLRKNPEYSFVPKRYVHREYTPWDENSIRKSNLKAIITRLAESYKADAATVTLWNTLHTQRSTDKRAFTEAKGTLQQIRSTTAKSQKNVTTDTTQLATDTRISTQLTNDAQDLSQDQVSASWWQRAAIADENQDVSQGTTVQDQDDTLYHYVNGWKPYEVDSIYATGQVDTGEASAAETIKNMLSTAEPALTTYQLSAATQEAETIAPQEAPKYTETELTNSLNAEVNTAMTSKTKAKTSRSFGQLVSSETSTDADINKASQMGANVNSANTSLTHRGQQLNLARKHLALATQKVNALEGQAKAALATWVRDGDPATLGEYNSMVLEINDLNTQIFQLSGTQRKNLSIVTAPPAPNTARDGDLESMENQMRENNLQERLTSEALLGEPFLTDPDLTNNDQSGTQIRYPIS